MTAGVADAVYVGRDCRRGDARYGNRAAKVQRGLSGAELGAAHEAAVSAYAHSLLGPGGEGRLEEVRQRLRGRRLACHCSGRGLACHGEVIAAVANCTEAELVGLVGFA